MNHLSHVIYQSEAEKDEWASFVCLFWGQTKEKKREKKSSIRQGMKMSGRKWPRWAKHYFKYSGKIGEEWHWLVNRDQEEWQKVASVMLENTGQAWGRLTEWQNGRDGQNTIQARQVRAKSGEEWHRVARVTQRERSVTIKVSSASEKNKKNITNSQTRPFQFPSTERCRVSTNFVPDQNDKQIFNW